MYAVVALAVGIPGTGAEGMGFGNQPPVIDGLTVSPNPAPANAPGTASPLTATITCKAHDPDQTLTSVTVTVSGGTLPGGGTSYAIAIPNLGSTSQDVVWTTPDVGSYAVTCAAKDSYAFPATGTSSVTVQTVVTAPPPIIDSLSGPATDTVLTGSAHELQVVAHDPGGLPLAYAWTATGGAIQANGDRATWTAPATGGQWELKVTVSNGVSAAPATRSLLVKTALAVWDGGVNAILSNPHRLARVASGDVYVVQPPGLLLVLTARGDVKARPSLSWADPQGVVHSESATAVAEGPDGVYVGTRSSLLLKVDPATGRVTKAIPTASSDIAGLAYDPARMRFWIAESTGKRLTAVRPDGAVVTEIVSYPDTASATGRSQLGAVSDVTVDAARGTVWAVVSRVSDGKIAYAFDLDGNFVKAIVDYGSADAAVAAPWGVTVDAAGRLYVSDGYYSRVQVYDGTGALLSSLGRFGSQPGNLRQPSGLALSVNGELLVANEDGGRLDRFGTGQGLPTCAGDADCDGLPDAWEIANGLNPAYAGDALIDSDQDGLTNAQELAYGTNPRNPDTDGDGYTDGAEVATGFNPLDPNDHKPRLAANDVQPREPGLVRLTAVVGNTTASCAVSWRQVGGPAVNLRDRTTLAPSFVARAAGTYVIEGTASCGGVASPATLVSAVVNNVAPRADGGRIVVARPGGKQVALDARFSTDANGDALSYAWDQTAGPAAQGRSQGPALTVRARTPGYYAFQATVKDGALEGTSEVPVLLVDDAGAPTALVVSPVTGEVGKVVGLDASASVAQQGSAVAWAQVEGPAATLDPPGSTTPSFVPPAPGRYVFEATVIEPTLRSPPARVEVYVAAAGTPLPAAAIAPVADPAAVGAPFDLDGRASAAGAGGALAYRWRQVAGPAVGLTEADQPVATAVPFQAGSYVFELAVSEGGAAGVPARVRVEARDGGLPIPIANASAPSVMHVGDVAVLDGRASVGARSHRWTQVGGPWTPLWQPASATPVLRPALAGVYAFELEVDDGVVRSAPAKVNVLVLPPEGTAP